MPLILRCDIVMFVEERQSKTGKAMVHAQAVSKGELLRVMAFSDGRDGDPAEKPILAETLRAMEQMKGPHFMEVSAMDGSFWIRRVLDKKTATSLPGLKE